MRPIRPALTLLSRLPEGRLPGLLLLATAVLLTLAGVPAHARDAADLAVSAQGRLAAAAGPAALTSPSGAWHLEVLAVRGGWQLAAADLAITGPDTPRRTLPDVAGTAFLITDAGRLVAISDVGDGACPTRVRVLDAAGQELWAQDVIGLCDPALASDGGSVVWRQHGGATNLDLAALTTTAHPPYVAVAAGPGGRFAGQLPDDPTTIVIAASAGAPPTVRLGFVPTALAFTPDGRYVLALGPAALVRVDTATGEAVVLLDPPVDATLRDLCLVDDGVVVGLCRHQGGSSGDGSIGDGSAEGELLVLAIDGRLLARRAGPREAIPASPPDRTHSPIPWPLAPNSQHEVGNTYGEYQEYGTGPYLHPGIDVMGTAGQAIYAVADGVVKALLTTSGDYHWRIATGAPGSGQSEGYLYAHVDRSTVAVSVGQAIVAGQYLGRLVSWPVANFHHCHFSRIRDTGTVWQGSWLATDNPHLDVPSTETDWPVFTRAIGSSWFAFCNNETSTYQNPTALHGAVDIIARVGDHIAGNWLCAVQEIRYTIHPVGQPESPVVDNRLAVRFDMALDTYFSGPIDPFLVSLLYKNDSTCHTYGDYDIRDFFHVITNNDGDEVYQESDRWQAWDTAQVYDGDYVVRVTATDAKGNAATVSQTVTTVNGNHPTAVGEAQAISLALACAPNPSTSGTSASFRLPAAGRATLAVYDLAGRCLRRLLAGDLPAGSHAATWDGRDNAGNRCPAGTYLLRLDAAAETRTQKVVLVW